jgi:acyl-CoA synthetase (AMP-forming)/AMP-acid ligase II
MTVRSLWEERVRNRGDDVFLIFQSHAFTYGEFDALVNRVADSLARLGVSKGDRVGGFMPNCLEWLVLYFAIAKLGAVNVFVNTQYDDNLLKHALVVSGVKGVLVSSSLLPMYEKIRGQLPGVDLEVLVRGDPSDQSTGALNMIPYDELLTGSPDPPPDPVISNGAPLQYIFTSGTTGLPKPCVTSQRYLLSMTGRIARLLKVDSQDRVFSCLPNYHGNVYIGTFTALIAGATAIVEASFSASKYWEWVRKYNATILTLHITPMNILLKQQPQPDDADNQARGGIFLVGEGAVPFLKRFGLSLGLAMYGSTEAGGFCTMSPFGPDSQHDARWAGRARDDVEVQIWDKNDEEVPAGEVGEIVIRDKISHTLFSGYYNMPEKTASACRNFWFHSGDMGYMDEEGSLYFVGRREESIRVKGEFIPVDRLEACIRSHAEVLECAAVGVPSDIGEEDAKVYVQCTKGSSLTEEGLIEHCQNSLPKFMIPRYVEFIEDFPIATSAMKIQKVKLKERGIGAAWDRMTSQDKA